MPHLPPGSLSHEKFGFRCLEVDDKAWWPTSREPLQRTKQHWPRLVYIPLSGNQVSAAPEIIFEHSLLTLPQLQSLTSSTLTHISTELRKGCNVLRVVQGQWRDRADVQWNVDLLRASRPSPAVVPCVRRRLGGWILKRTDPPDQPGHEERQPDRQQTVEPHERRGKGAERSRHRGSCSPPQLAPPPAVFSYSYSGFLIRGKRVLLLLRRCAHS
eukprot:scaffold106577_cov30-Tisochrysis_lutea.AAC.3